MGLSTLTVNSDSVVGGIRVLFNSHPPSLKKLVILSIVFSTLLFGLFFEFEESDASSSGHFGKDCDWTLDDKGTLTFTGTGRILSSYINSAPWDKELVKNIIIGDDISSFDGFLAYKNLKSVVIGNSITNIGGSAFSGSSLESVVIGESVKTISEHAFVGSDSLATFSLNNKNVNFVVKDGDLFDSDMKRLVRCSVGKYSYTVPEGIEVIDEGALPKCIVSITLPHSLKNMPNRNMGSSNLAEIINNSSFNVELGEGFAKYASSVKVVGTTDITNRDGYLFLNTNNFCQFVGYVGDDTNLSLTEQFEGRNYSIKSYAFQNNKVISSLVLGDPVTKIGHFAFNCCSSLSSLTIGDSVNTIGEEAFSGCNLSSVSFGKTKISFQKSVIGYGVQYRNTVDPYDGFGSYFYDEYGNKITNSSSLCNHTYTLVNGRLVQVASIHVTGLSLDKQSLVLNVNQTSAITATVSPDNSTDKSVSWKSSDIKVATVDQNGMVKGISEGNATITATSNDGGKTATCSVTVKAASQTPSQESSGSDNTLLYICIAIVIAILVALALLFMKRSNKR